MYESIKPSDFLSNQIYEFNSALIWLFKKKNTYDFDFWGKKENTDLCAIATFQPSQQLGLYKVNQKCQVI